LLYILYIYIFGAQCYFLRRFNELCAIPSPAHKITTMRYVLRNILDP